MKRLYLIYVAVYIISSALSAQPLHIKTSHSKSDQNIAIRLGLHKNINLKDINVLGKITQEVWQKWSEITLQYDNKDQYLNIYDAINGYLIELVHQEWDGVQWINSDLYIYAYDINELLTGYTYHEWDGRVWEHVGTGEFSNYDSNGNYGEESYLELVDGNFEYRDRFVYNYDSNNDMIEYFSYYFEDPDWLPFDWYQYEYDGNCMITSTEYAWDGSQYVLVNKLEFNYDYGCFAPVPHADFWWLYDGSPTSWTYSIWNGTQWESSLHGEYIVNDCGWTINGILYRDYDENSMTWSGENARGFINYNVGCGGPAPDVNDVRIISAEYQEFESGDWVNSERTWISYEGLLLDTKNEETIITNYCLKQNYPNPFNPETTIEFTVPEMQVNLNNFIQLIVYDILGNEISTLVSEEMYSGEYSVKFNIETLNISSLSNGIYYYKLQIGDKSIVKKMLLVK